MAKHYTKEYIDHWIKCAELESVVSIYNSAIELDLLYSSVVLAEVEGAEYWEDDGYRMLARLLEVAQDPGNEFNSGL
jgi:hypothetical protein